MTPTRRTTTLCALAAAVGTALAFPLAQANAAGIDTIDIREVRDAFDGAIPPGAAGPYVLLQGVMTARIDPAAPANAGIIDLALAPRDADGLVRYQTDIAILRPKHGRHASRVVIYDVVNRGRPVAAGVADVTGAAGPAQDFPSILQHGHTLVWSGWQGDVPLHAASKGFALGTAFPVAVQADGTPVTGASREEYVATAPGAYRFALSYPAADPGARDAVVFTARQTWRDAQGRLVPDAPAAPVTDWRYDTPASVSFTPPAAVPLPEGGSAAPDAGTIYSFVYTARDPKVMGLGFAAIRDVMSFLRHSPQDAAGQVNPLADFRTACDTGRTCADPQAFFDTGLATGLSQSGRVLRDFLYQGFNQSLANDRVFDGMLAMIPGARRTWVNTRFAQPGRWSRQHEDHWMPGDQFPFSYAELTDPASGRRDSLMAACRSTHTCPRILQLDGSYEWWGGRASLITTDGQGRDIMLPDDVRYYTVAGTQHNGGPGLADGLPAAPKPGQACALPVNPVPIAPTARALLSALIDWTRQGTPPPPSRYPRVDAGELAAPDALGWDARLPATITIPVRGGEATLALPRSLAPLLNTLLPTDYAQAVPRVDRARPYTVLVPSLDETGNETAGIRTPEVTVPLASYTGWNPRAAGFGAGEACPAMGAAIPLTRDETTRVSGDTRPALAQRYADRAAYAHALREAADALVAARLLLPADAERSYGTQAAGRIDARLLP